VFSLKSFFEKTVSHDERFKVLQNVESVGLTYTEHAWNVSYFLDFRNRDKNKEDFSWIRFSFNDQGTIIEQIVERYGKSILPDEDFFACAMSTDVVFERIQSAQTLLKTRFFINNCTALPDISFFEYDDTSKKASLQFSFSPLLFELFLSPSKGITKIAAFYTEDTENFPFSGCHLSLHASLYFKEEIITQLNEYVKQKIRLKYFF